MRTLFISDLHLSDARPDISRAFERFIEQQAFDCQALYVLGDLFDVWVGDDYQDNCSTLVESCFKRLHKAGVPVFYVHGNRDFLLGQRFAQRCQVELLPEKAVIDLYGQPTLIMHGDTLCTLDIAYQKFRRKSRSWWWQTLILALPLWYRRKRATAYRAASHQAKAMKSSTIMDVTNDEVVTEMERHHVELLIHGHTHRPAYHTVKLSSGIGTRWVLGDWDKQISYLEITPSDQQLKNQPL